MGAGAGGSGGLAPGAAEGMQFSWRWNGGTISPNLGVIWEMSVKGFRAVSLKWSIAGFAGTDRRIAV